MSTSGSQTIAETEPETVGGTGPADADDRGRTTFATWAIRLSFVLLAFGALWLAQFEDQRFRETAASAFRFDLRQWSASITPLILAGVFFAVAARFPFPRPRFAWSRSILAAIAIVPVVHLGFLMWAPQFTVHWPTFLVTPRWFEDGSIPAAGAVLAGVAIGCGFGARRAATDDG